MRKRIKIFVDREEDILFRSSDMLNVSGHVEIIFNSEGKPCATPIVAGGNLTILNQEGQPVSKLQAIINPYTGRLIWAPCTANEISISAEAETCLPLLPTLRYRFGEPHVPAYATPVSTCAYYYR